MRSIVAAGARRRDALIVGQRSRSALPRATFAAMTRLPLAAALLAAAALGFWGCDSTEPAENEHVDSGSDSPTIPSDASLPETSTGECVEVAPPTACPEPPVTFEDVARTIGARCTTPCHNGAPNNGQWSLLTYDDVSHWKNEIRGALLSCAMPPLDGGVGITADEKLAILTFLRCGLPR